MRLFWRQCCKAQVRVSGLYRLTVQDLLRLFGFDSRIGMLGSGLSARLGVHG